MGCYSSRSFPLGSKEWVILEVLHAEKASKLSIPQINTALAKYPQSFLLIMNLAEVARELGVDLDSDLFQESPQDQRISKWKLYVTLIMLSNADQSSKTAALKSSMNKGPRTLMQFLEWRTELLNKRLIDLAVKKDLLTFSEARTLKMREIPGVFQESTKTFSTLSRSRNLMDELVSQNLLQIKP